MSGRLAAALKEKAGAIGKLRLWQHTDCSESLIVVRKIEQVKEIVDGRAVDRHIGVARRCNRVGKVVTAAACDSLQAPVPLDELQDRNVVGIRVVNVPRFYVGRHGEEDDTRAVAEVIERLYVAGIIVTAAFILGDEDRGVFPELRVLLDFIYDLLAEAFKEIELGR